MSTTQFGILSTFDHKVQSWKSFKGRLEQWFIANSIDSKSDTAGIKRRAILLSVLTDDTYQLTSDLALPKDLQTVPFEDIVGLLDGHFTPKRCGFSERYQFYAAVQHVSESHTQWAARLRGLAAHCEFSNIEEALCDRFVMGMSAGPEREKLFAQDLKDLTLVKAVNLAASVKCARAGAAASSPSLQQQQPRSETLFKIDNRVPGGERQVKVKCSVCGRSNHKANQCRFAKYRCKKCNVLGHLQRMCKNVNRVEQDDVDETDDDDGKLYNIRTVRGEPMVEVMSICGVPVTFEIDSGSAVTVIPQSHYKQYFKKMPLLYTKKRLITYTGDRISCVGILRAPMMYKGRTHTLDIYAVRSGGPPLLGRDFLSLFQFKLSACRFVKASNDVVDELQSRYPKLFSEDLGAFNKYK